MPLTDDIAEETSIWEDQNMPANFRLKGALVCMWYLAPLAKSRPTFERVIHDCLSQKKYTIALLEALGPTSDEVVACVCSKFRPFSGAHT